MGNQNKNSNLDLCHNPEFMILYVGAFYLFCTGFYKETFCYAVVGEGYEVGSLD